MLDFSQQGGWLLIPALATGIVNWIAVARAQKRVEYVVKPGTLILVIIAALLLMRGAGDARLALFFVLGLCFSLAGDVFLMLPGERFFIPGLISFFVAHVFYIIGLNPTLPPLGSVIVLIVVAALGVMLYMRIAASLRQKGEEAMRRRGRRCSARRGRPPPASPRSWARRSSSSPIRCWRGTNSSRRRM